jgi:hypothetical protein
LNKLILVNGNQRLRITIVAMNEWQLQHALTKMFREKKFKYKDDIYELVCWELMFPSWEINNKYGKWTEKSIDFIFYCETTNTFLCCELKNLIKTRKELLSAYCQTIDRTVSFTNSYKPERAMNAMKICFENSILERGGSTKHSLPFEFSAAPNIQMLLLCWQINEKLLDDFRNWNEMNHASLAIETSAYKPNKEFTRFQCLNQNDLVLLKDREVNLLALDNSLSLDQLPK